MKKILLTLSAIALIIAACNPFSSDADVASENLSRAADQFEIPRRVVFFNGITDTYLLEIQGFCSIKADVGEFGDGQLEATCRRDGGFIKHFLGLSDNVSYFVEQLDPAIVSTGHYRVIFKPSAIIPAPDIQ